MTSEGNRITYEKATRRLKIKATLARAKPHKEDKEKYIPPISRPNTFIFFSIWLLAIAVGAAWLFWLFQIGEYMKS